MMDIFFDNDSLKKLHHRYYKKFIDSFTNVFHEATFNEDTLLRGKL